MEVSGEISECEDGCGIVTNLKANIPWEVDPEGKTSS